MSPNEDSSKLITNVTLNGINYLSWARATTLALSQWQREARFYNRDKKATKIVNSSQRRRTDQT